MKKVKPRLSKDMLKAAGEAFAQRHRGQLLNPNASESSAACQVLEKVPPRREAAVRGSEGMSRVEEQRGGIWSCGAVRCSCGAVGVQLGCIATKAPT